MYNSYPFYNLSFSSLTTIIIVPSEENQSQINVAPSWSKPCLQVELENEDPLSAIDLKVSGKNKTPQRSIHSHIYLWFDIFSLFKFSFDFMSSLQPMMPPVINVIQYLCWMLEKNAILSVLNIHRMEGRWANRQSATEDASLLEQATEPSVSNKLMDRGALLLQGTGLQLSLFCLCLFV